MIKYRIIAGNTIVEFLTIDSAQAYAALHDNAGEIVEFDEPMSQATQLDILEDLSDKYISYGMNLYKAIKKKIWALNTYNKSLGNNLTIEQMKTLLATSDILQKSLETGSLLTAIDVLNGLKAGLPQYASVVDYALADIANFLG